MKAVINEGRLAMLSVMGEVHHPTMGANPWRLNHDGTPHVLPGVGGITYNVKIGDSVFSMEVDHVEPGVSAKNKDENENAAFTALSCIGNVAVVMSGDAKGAKGFVTGTHGGIEHVLIYFDAETLDKLCVGDKIQVRAQGQGMLIEGFEQSVRAMSCSPELFHKMNIEVKDGKLVVPVAHRVPAYLMGSGIGNNSSYRGDYDIMTEDAAEIKRLGLDKLRYGDIVLLENCDTSYGRGYLTGSVTVGVVVHSNCILMGHGPGVTTLLTAKTPVIETVICPNANLADYFGV
ncbi:MAG TPA: DUF4438 domain-containing protein [Eubacteriales bacterium]|nr:DUF4438 domain-containing protein [Clostridia bacterium]HRV72875.1 DUF4438 domain-containing protein [Eubacteriales bacterium]